MRRIVRIFLCMFLLVLAGACARHKIIPDRKLAQIFHDASSPTPISAANRWTSIR